MTHHLMVKYLILELLFTLKDLWPNKSFISTMPVDASNFLCNFFNNNIYNSILFILLVSVIHYNAQRYISYASFRIIVYFLAILNDRWFIYLF